MRVLAIVHQADAGAGVFGEVVRESGHELVEWFPTNGGAPELDGVGAAMVFGGAMNVDQEAANPWLRGEKELLRRMIGDGLPLIGVCLGSQLLAEAAGAAPKRASRAGDRLGAGGADRRGTRGPAARRAARSASRRSSGTATRRSCPTAPWRWPAARCAFRPTGWRARERGASSSTPRSPAPRSTPGSTAGTRTRTPCGSGSTRRRLRAETLARLPDWNELGRGIAERFLAEAAGAPVTRG